MHIFYGSDIARAFRKSVFSFFAESAALIFQSRYFQYFTSRGGLIKKRPAALEPPDGYGYRSYLFEAVFCFESGIYRLIAFLP